MSTLERDIRTERDIQIEREGLFARLDSVFMRRDFVAFDQTYGKT